MYFQTAFFNVGWRDEILNYACVFIP